MSSKKKTAKKGKGGKGKGKKNDEIAELRTMIEALKKEMDSMSKTIKKQNKRISSLETDNKRFKKSLHKMQMNGGGSNQLSVSPRESATNIVPSDIDHHSDADSKEDDDSKENNQETKSSKKESKKKKEKEEKKKEEPKPKPVARRNRVKPKKKAEDITFTFDLHHQKIKTAENGQAAMKPKVFAGTIRFGRFLHFTKNNNDKIASYIITFDTRSIGQNASTAFGFATNRFNNWVGSNFGQNNCCVVKGI